MLKWLKSKIKSTKAIQSSFREDVITLYNLEVTIKQMTYVRLLGFNIQGYSKKYISQIKEKESNQILYTDKTI